MVYEFLDSETPSSEHLGRHRLGQFFAQELRGSELATVETHLATCAQCMANLRVLDVDQRAFLVQHPTSSFLAGIEARQRWRWQWPAFGLAMAAAGIFMMLSPSPTQPLIGQNPHSGTRIKATVSLSFHVQSQSGIILGQDGGSYHPGDAIQLRYTSTQHTRLVVISVDAAGAVTAFYDDAGQALVIKPGVGELLEGSIVLDDTLGAERVIGCFADKTLSTAAVVAAGEKALKAADGNPRQVKALDLPCTQATFLLEKRHP